MKTKKKLKQNQQQTIVDMLLFQFFPYWPLFLGLAIVMFAGGWVYLQVANPVYEAKATLLIKDEKKGVENPQMMESLNIYTSKKIVENEIEVIKSRTLIRETINILHLSSPVLEEGFLSPRLAYTSSPVAVELRNIDNTLEAERVNFTYDERSKTVTFVDNNYKLNEWIKSPYGEIRFIKNPYQKTRGTGPFFVALLDPRKIIDGLQKNLNVQPSNKLTTVVILSIRDAIPARAENILNILMESYTKAAINDKNRLAENTLEFVEARIKLVEHDLDSLERSIQQYKSTRGIVDLSEQGRVFLKNVGDNDQQLSQLDMQLAVLDKAEDYVVKRDSTAQIVPSTLGINDERLTTLIQKLYDSELEYKSLKRTTAENNPILLSLQSEIENIRPSVLENIRNQKSNLVASRANLTTTNDKYTSALTSIPKKERDLLEANRQQAIKNNVYNFLLQKREETALSTGATVGDSRLVDRAEASIFPVSPKKTMVYGGALALAFLLGFGWVVATEMFSTKVLFRSEIESATKIPVAAEISDSQMKNTVVIDNLKKPFLTEQFVQLRAAVGFFGNSPKKMLCVTSSIGGEGKSFVSTNFAISLAGFDKRVLLVDIDLRNPRLSRLYNAGEVPGMAELLNGETTIDKVVRRTATPNLFLVGAGRKRASATGKLLNGDLEGLFTTMRDSFDYIVVDTPPVTPVIDAFVISPFCDATLFIVRHGKTPKRVLQQLDENSKIRSLPNLAIVFNGIRPRGLVKNSYGYGYGYEYEYTYPKRK